MRKGNSVIYDANDNGLRICGKEFVPKNGFDIIFKAWNWWSGKNNSEACELSVVTLLIDLVFLQINEEPGQQDRLSFGSSNSLLQLRDVSNEPAKFNRRHFRTEVANFTLRSSNSVPEPNKIIKQNAIRIAAVAVPDFDLNRRPFFGKQ
ncbi:hypothetical protein IWQ54_006587 [Labrenzia sp. EL_195]|nr:hypothetical protein [Labrenzia sp. EL_195]